MKHFINNGVYYVVDSNNQVLLSCQLVEDVGGNQVILSTKKEVYSGPVENIQFKED